MELTDEDKFAKVVKMPCPLNEWDKPEFGIKDPPKKKEPSTGNLILSALSKHPPLSSEDESERPLPTPGKQVPVKKVVEETARSNVTEIAKKEDLGDQFDERYLEKINRPILEMETEYAKSKIDLMVGVQPRKGEVRRSSQIDGQNTSVFGSNTSLADIMVPRNGVFAVVDRTQLGSQSYVSLNPKIMTRKEYTETIIPQNESLAHIS